MLRNSKLIVSFFFLFIACTTYCQITFQSAIDGGRYNVANEFAHTSDGNYILIGSAFLDTNGVDVFLVKADSNGNMIWGKTFGGSLDDYGRSIKQTKDGGFIISGITYSFGAGNAEVYLIKTDSSGELMWSKTFGGVNDEFGDNVFEMGDDGFIITGFSQSFKFGAFFGYSQFYVIKTDSAGELLWSKTYGNPDPSNESALFSQRTKDGGFIMVGFSDCFGVAPWDVCLVRIDSSGNLLWSKVYGNPGYQEALSVQQTDDNGFIIAGAKTLPLSNVKDILLMKTTEDGSLEWTKSYSNIGNDNGFSVRPIGNHKYIVCGTVEIETVFKAFIFQSDSIGNIDWMKTYGGNYGFGRYLEIEKDSGYTFVGDSEFGLYFVKTDVYGNSGCNDSDITIPVIVETLQNIDCSIEALSQTSFVTNPATIIGSGGSSIPICFSNSIFDINKTEFVISIFPNPAENNFTILMNEKIEGGKVEIYDLYGKNIFSSNFRDTKMLINIENFSPGIYLLKILSAEKKFCKRLVIR